MPKIRKKSLKGSEITQSDEFISTSERVFEYVSENTTKVVAAIGVVVLVVAVFIGATYWKEGKTGKASYLLHQAWMHMQAADTRDDKDKMAADLTSARTICENILKDYSGTAAAPTAHYYLGGIDARMERWDDAIKHYEAFVAQGKNETVNAAVKQKIAYAKLAKGDKEGALKDMELLLADDAAAKDLVHLEKGRLLEKMGKTDEAIKEYQAVIDGFKESPFLSDATMRFVALGGKMPETPVAGLEELDKALGKSAGQAEKKVGASEGPTP